MAHHIYLMAAAIDTINKTDLKINERSNVEMQESLK